ncbi:type II toxin-antitoxin system Phd/YefM family antitoxin [Actinomadura formosensis]|uniref:type II toxin-antitoxin system Phd/YefM family antitoxin n=1 Tax=Actinomadura formosensis TaxID=60706 RepID=UPI00082DA18F|nr:type II toxin-antitoxin system Phd/YefM family antitoxin [Actinomadura formosensis]
MSTERIATNDLRAHLGRRIDEAHFRGDHLIVEKNGEPRAVLVPYKWWQEKQAAAEPGLTPP